MADLGDVTAFLANMVWSAVFPSGANQPNVAGATVKVFEGWPIPATLDTDIAAGAAQISIFPLKSAGASIEQFINNEQYTIKAPTPGMTAVVSNTSVTLTGTPVTGEYASITVNKQNTYSASGPTVSAILAGIASQAGGMVSVSGNTITFPNTNLLTCQIGAPGVAGFVTHRQRQPIQITVWAPNPPMRNVLASAVGNALRQSVRITFPDTSQGLLVFSHETQTDEQERASIYRRDMIFNVDYATLETYAVNEITSFGATFDDGTSFLGHVSTSVISAG